MCKQSQPWISHFSLEFLDCSFFFGFVNFVTSYSLPIDSLCKLALPSISQDCVDNFNPFSSCIGATAAIPLWSIRSSTDGGTCVIRLFSAGVNSPRVKAMKSSSTSRILSLPSLTSILLLNSVLLLVTVCLHMLCTCHLLCTIDSAIRFALFWCFCWSFVTVTLFRSLTFLISISFVNDGFE